VEYFKFNIFQLVSELYNLFSNQGGNLVIFVTNLRGELEMQSEHKSPAVTKILSEKITTTEFKEAKDLSIVTPPGVVTAAQPEITLNDQIVIKLAGTQIHMINKTTKAKAICMKENIGMLPNFVATNNYLFVAGIYSFGDAIKAKSCESSFWIYDVNKLELKEGRRNYTNFNKCQSISLNKLAGDRVLVADRIVIKVGHCGINGGFTLDETFKHVLVIPGSDFAVACCDKSGGTKDEIQIYDLGGDKPEFLHTIMKVEGTIDRITFEPETASICIVERRKAKKRGEEDQQREIRIPASYISKLLDDYLDEALSAFSMDVVGVVRSYLIHCPATLFKPSTTDASAAIVPSVVPSGPR
jgi:hypothetical protein